MVIDILITYSLTGSIAVTTAVSLRNMEVIWDLMVFVRLTFVGLECHAGVSMR